MENGYRMDIVPLEMDRDEETSAESTLSNSLDESSITVESSRVGADLKLDACDGWTNEKHNSYLNNLETSFVSQFYSLLGGESQRLSTTCDLQPNSRKSTDQFTVLQNGCWQKVNFGKKQNRTYTMRTTNDETKHSADKAFTRTTLRGFVGSEYPDQSTAESSGQNFRQEKGCDSEVTGKRKKRSK